MQIGLMLKGWQARLLSGNKVRNCREWAGGRCGTLSAGSPKASRGLAEKRFPVQHLAVLRPIWKARRFESRCG